MFSSVSAPFCWPTTTTRRPSIRAKPGDHRLVVAEQPVAVELDELVGHRGDELEGPRPAQVAGQLDAAQTVVARIVAGSAVRGGAGRRGAVGRGPRSVDPTGKRRQERERPEPEPSSEAELGRRRPGTGSRPGRRRSRCGQLVAQRRAGHDRSMNPWLNRNSERWKPTGSSCGDRPAETREPANPISAFGSAMLTSPTAANEAKTPPVVGSDRTADERHAGRAQALEGRERLGQLHQGQRAFLHPGAARCADDDERQPRARGRASAARVTFSPTTAPIEPPMNPKSMTQMATGVPPMAPVPQTAASRMPVAAWAAATRSG